MNLQNIRKYYEYPVIDCCNLGGVEFRAENTLEPGGDAIHKFCLARLQFGEMAEQTVACGPFSNKRAVFIVEYYGPKGIGPSRRARLYGMRNLQIPRPKRHYQHQRPRLHFT